MTSRTMSFVCDVTSGPKPDPCARCGVADPRIVFQENDGANRFWFGCRGCGSSTDEYPVLSEALAAWNEGRLLYPPEEPAWEGYR